MSIGFDVNITGQNYHIVLDEPKAEASHQLTVLKLLEKIEVVFDSCLQYDQMQAMPFADPFADPLTVPYEFLKEKTRLLTSAGILGRLRKATFGQSSVQVEIEISSQRIFTRSHFIFLNPERVRRIFTLLQTRDALTLSAVNRSMRGCFTDYLNDRFSLSLYTFHKCGQSNRSLDIKTFLEELPGKSVEELVPLLKMTDRELVKRVRRCLQEKLPQPIPQEIQSRTIEALSDSLSPSVIESLFKLGFALDSQSGGNSLIQLFMTKDVDRNALIKARPDIVQYPGIIHWFVKTQHSGRFRHVLKLGADLNALDDMKRSPLHWAAKADKGWWLTDLLDAQANPNLSDSSQKTPLRLACEEVKDNDLLYKVTCLVEAGATISDEDIKQARWSTKTVAYLKAQRQIQELKERVITLEAQMSDLQARLAQVWI